MARRTFSIITVSCDQGAALRGAIESVVQQGTEGVEHIVVERGSSLDAAAIAQEYPHVVFIQEPLAHESQAFNCALSVASGDIISFLAPTERYCADALWCVSQQIDRHPIVMGAVSLTNQSGDVVERIDNTERSWFDSIKYWVARAVPVRAGVFFKRSVLNELGIDGGDTFDEGLRFVPEFDLWLRIQERHPLSLRIPQVVATSPVNYSKLSTGYQRELSRLFRRHCARRVHPEQTLSFVVECSEHEPKLDLFVDLIDKQQMPGLEIVLVDSVGTRASYEKLCARVSAYEAKFRELSFQVITTHTDPESKVVPIDRGVRAAGSLLVACIAPCDDLPLDFATGVLRAFSRDEVGLLLPRLEKRAAGQLFTMKHGTAVFNPAGTFSFSPHTRIDWIARKVAWLDCGGSLIQDKLLEQEFVMKRLMIMMAHKAWRIVHEPLLVDTRAKITASDEEPFRLYVNSLVVDELAREMKRNPFSVARAHNGFGLVLSDDLWQAAQEIIQNIPEVATTTDQEISVEALRAIIRKRPAYGPAHYALAKVLRDAGDARLAAAARAQWEQLHEEEKVSPLYGVASISDVRRS